MRDINTVIKSIEAGSDAFGILATHSDWQELKAIIAKEFPEYSRLAMGSVYRFAGKKGLQCRAVVTKENDKTWVLYEVVNSSRPGTRWMISKTWCSKGNIRRDEAQSYELPTHTVIK